MIKKQLWLVEIDFYDHTGNDSGVAEPFRCQAYGVLFCETDLDYRIASWVTGGVIGDHNTESYSILKSAVVKLSKIKKIK